MLLSLFIPNVCIGIKYWKTCLVIAFFTFCIVLSTIEVIWTFATKYSLIFYVLLTVHPVTTLGKWPTWCTKTLCNMFIIIILYIFWGFNGRASQTNNELISDIKHKYNYVLVMVFIGKVDNHMFRPKAAIFRLSQLQFCSKSIIYIYIYIYASLRKL